MPLGDDFDGTIGHFEGTFPNESPNGNKHTEAPARQRG